MANSFDSSRKGRDAGHGAPGAKLIKRRKNWKNRSAVSEIIANMLILSITVIMFSGIFVFVSSMDGPSEKVYTDFVGSVVLNEDGKTVKEIKIVNKGGHPLEDHRTAIYLFVEGDVQSLGITGHIPLEKTTWNTGVTWTYDSPVKKDGSSIERDDNLRVMIVDMQANTVVWESTLQDNSATSSQPIIADRYLASKVSDGIWIRDTSFTNNQQVALFVNVLDAGNDLSHLTNLGAVYADVSSLGGPKKLLLSDTNGDNWWSETFQVKDAGSGLRTIHITAVDDGGRTATASLTVNVRVGDGGSTPGGGGSGGPPGNLNYNGLQGLNVFKYREWTNRNYSADPTTQFDHGEQGVVVVASKFLVNLENANDFFIVDPTTGTIYKEVSSPSVVFHHYDYYSGYYIYTAIINTDKLVDNKQYMLQIQLRDSWLPNNNVFFATANISVGNAEMPKFETFSDPGYLKECNDFNSSSKIYVKITTAGNGKVIPDSGLVMISDYFHNTQVKRIPPQTKDISNPVGIVTLTNGPNGEGIYKFVIDLSRAHQDPWIPGKNAYSLRFDMFNTETERHLLFKTINITAPKVILDMATGIDAVKGGWATGSLVNFYKNDNQWVPPDFINPWPGKHATEYTSATFVRLGDINNNGKNDVIAVLNGKHICMYVNNGQWSPRPIVDEDNERGTITAIELGYVDGDNSIDIIVGYSDGKMGYYRNDGVWTHYAIGSAPSGSAKVTAIVACDSRNIAATQGRPSGMDVIAGYESGGVLIWKSANNLGVTWSSQQYAGGTLSFSQHSASYEESKYSYTSHGTFASTAWDGAGYEQLWEENGPGTDTSLPSTPLNYVPRPTDDNRASVLLSPSSNPLVLSGWSDVVAQTFKASLVFDYRVGDDYSKGLSSGTQSYIQWRLEGQPTYNSLYEIKSSQTSRSGPIMIEIQGIDTLSELRSLHIELNNVASTHTNEGKDRNIYIYNCRIIVEFTGNYYQMDHEWTFDGISQSTMNTFDIYASVGGEEGHDSFKFQYRWSNQATFSDFSTPLVVDAVGMTRYSGTIGATPAGATAIVIRAIDNNPLSLVNTALTIQRMCINTTEISSDPIGSVTSIRVADMDGKNGPDMVISDKSNIWVCLNDGHGNLLSSTSKITSGKPLSNILTIGVGKFHGSDSHPSIVVGTTTGVYMVKQSTLGNYDAWVSLFTTSINSNSNGDVCMVVGDVEGDGDADIVIASGTYLNLFTNDVEDGKSTFRNGVTVDVSASTIKSLYLGKLQNN